MSEEKKEINNLEKKEENIYLDKITMEEERTFDVLVIKHGSIKELSWFDKNYAQNLMKLDLFETVSVNSENFLEIVATKLQMDKYNLKDPYVKNEIIGDEPEYVYELMYVDLEKENEYNKPELENELATLINLNGEKIYSNAILFKNHLPSLSDSMHLVSTTKDDLARILHNRVHTKVVVYDDDGFREEVVVGDLNNFANEFFDDKFEKKEMAFLMHNINIWHQSFDYGNKNVCGKLLDKLIEKCIIFSMKSEEYRCNITLDEVKKIIHLSNKLDDFRPPSELMTERRDKLGRKIVYNKYKVLEYVYNKNK